MGFMRLGMGFMRFSIWELLWIHWFFSGIHGIEYEKCFESTGFPLVFKSKNWDFSKNEGDHPCWLIGRDQPKSSITKSFWNVGVEENLGLQKKYELLSLPIGIYANIGGILMVNVTIYTIHGSYGLCNGHDDWMICGSPMTWETPSYGNSSSGQRQPQDDHHPRPDPSTRERCCRTRSVRWRKTIGYH